MLFLRQSTASQEILLGPFVDSTDGVTPENGLTIANTDIKLWVEGATTLANKNSGGATYITSSNGLYYAVLDATDTATVGKMEAHVYVSGALPIKREYHVLEEAIYDTLFAASAVGYPTAAEIADGVWDEARSGHATNGTFGESFAAIVAGQCITGTLSTTQATTNLTEATDDHFIGRTIVWITGALLGQASGITDYDGATKMLTFSATTEAAANGDRFVLV